MADKHSHQPKQRNPRSGGCRIKHPNALHPGSTQTTPPIFLPPPISVDVTGPSTIPCRLPVSTQASPSQRSAVPTWYRESPKGLDCLSVSGHLSGRVRPFRHHPAHRHHAEALPVVSRGGDRRHRRRCRLDPPTPASRGHLVYRLPLHHRRTSPVHRTRCAHATDVSLRPLMSNARFRVGATNHPGNTLE